MPYSVDDEEWTYPPQNPMRLPKQTPTDDVDGIRRRSSMSSDRTIDVPDEESFNLEKSVRVLKKRRNTARIKPRSLGVGFRNLTVTGLGSSESYIPTVGSIFNPRVILEQVQKIRHPAVRRILSGFQGVVRPGEMLLVLGSPGSGCSTFLKCLVGQRKEYHSVDGDVCYDSMTLEEMQTRFRGDLQYCPEDDIHFPSISVHDTLSFAAAARTPRDRAGESKREYTEKIVNILASTFGLKHTLSTPVGDNMIRGVSGGEKKRVSIAETLSARGCIAAFDNSTRGLDSSTALEFIQALRTATDELQTTTIVSLYQAGESLYEYFNKVCVIYEGKMAYYGPASEAKQYFIDMGYQPANRQTTADFLVAVTDPKGRIPRPGISNQPRTADEFATYFRRSMHGQRNAGEVQLYMNFCVNNELLRNAYIQSATAEFSRHSQSGSPYLLNLAEQVAIVMRRRVQILRGNMLATFLLLFTFTFQAIVMGTVFLHTKAVTSGFFARGSALFFTVLFNAITSMAEIPALYSQRPIILRHQKGGLYRPFVEALALTLVDIPITAVITIVYSSIFYWLVGFQRSVSQFALFNLFTIGISVAMKAWFRGLSAAFASEAAAQSLAGISALILILYAGYTTPRPTMIGALRWLVYVNPLKYGFEALMTNEFHTLKAECSNLVPQGPGYHNVTLANQVCATVGALPGQSFVNGNRFTELSFEFKYSRLWMDFGIITAFFGGFLGALLIFTEYNTSMARDTPVVRWKRGAQVKRSDNNITTGGDDDEERGAAGASTTTYPPPPQMRRFKSSSKAPQQTDVFSWRGINYTVPIPGQTDRQLLSDVSGYVAPGKLTALMGESGAGKTTLLNVLAMRTADVGVVSGERLVNGQALPADFQSQSGYCQQMDTHVPTSTVREALLFSAKLRQPPSVPLAEKEAYVERCLEMCGLKEYADAAVGTLNMEHRKRTTIGVELAARPKLLLFLDEPTSGLDSQSAWAIVSFLRSLADSGQAILCTIHQPSAELFQVFDRLLLLKKGGKTVYFGDVGPNASTLIRYFEKNGARKCPPEANPAEYMLGVIGAGATASRSMDWHDVWVNSPEARALQRELEEIHKQGRSRKVSTELRTEFATPWFFQLRELIRRDAEAHWRDPTYIAAKMVLNSIGGLIVGITFLKSKNSQQGIQNKLFAIFMATVLSVPLSNQLQVQFINMRTVYEVRERPSRMYSWTALLMASILVELFWNVIGSFFLFVSWYWTIGFENGRAGYTYLMLGIVFPLYYGTLAQAAALMAPNAEIAGVLFSFLFSFVVTLQVD
ncbi:hypothetical protein D9613_003579 [Agrocybe pediades]|uniref:ABC transporter domain-containing protein n=1 Tax=Agrocybe pediades TaxID=84607 RepID=A0A8H4QJ40_9AGAR|nr:hypothetical protein D9613_003579 [Agrocybe pediades]